MLMKLVVMLHGVVYFACREAGMESHAVTIVTIVIVSRGYGRRESLLFCRGLAGKTGSRFMDACCHDINSLISFYVCFSNNLKRHLQLVQ